MSTELDFDQLVEDIRRLCDPDSSYWMERLLHTYVGNPVAALFTQAEILQRVAERKPEMLPEEIARLKEQTRTASDKIVMIVKALAAAYPRKD
jgi:hypothetical protein